MAEVIETCVDEMRLRSTRRNVRLVVALPLLILAGLLCLALAYSMLPPSASQQQFVEWLAPWLAGGGVLILMIVMGLLDWRSRRVQAKCPSCGHGLATGIFTAIRTRSCPRCWKRIVATGKARSERVWRRYRRIQSRREVALCFWLVPVIAWGCVFSRMTTVDLPRMPVSVLAVLFALIAVAAMYGYRTRNRRVWWPIVIAIAGAMTFAFLL